MSSIQPGKHITTSENQLLELQTCTQHMAGTLVRRSRRKGVSDYLYKILFFFLYKILKILLSIFRIHPRNLGWVYKWGSVCKRAAWGQGFWQNVINGWCKHSCLWVTGLHFFLLLNHFSWEKGGLEKKRAGVIRREKRIVLCDMDKTEVKNCSESLVCLSSQIFLIAHAVCYN